MKYFLITIFFKKFLKHWHILFLLQVLKWFYCFSNNVLRFWLAFENNAFHNWVFQCLLCFCWFSSIRLLMAGRYCGYSLSVSDYFTYYNLFCFQVLPCCHKWQAFLLFYGWIILYKYFIVVYKHHIFFNHLSVDGHLPCFHILAIMNSPSMNTEMQITL